MKSPGPAIRTRVKFGAIVLRESYNRLVAKGFLIAIISLSTLFLIVGYGVLLEPNWLEVAHFDFVGNAANPPPNYFVMSNLLWAYGPSLETGKIGPTQTIKNCSVCLEFNFSSMRRLTFVLMFPCLGLTIVIQEILSV